MMRSGSAEFRATVDKVAQQLAVAEHRDGWSFIKTPLLYPGGTSVVIRVSDSHPEFVVSDFGLGNDEAEQMGALPNYASQARQVAKDAGIGFDTQAFFVVRATRDQLAGAIVTVANCSKDAVTLAWLKASQKRRADEVDALYQRLTAVFHDRVARNVQVTGASEAWDVAAVVRGAHRSTVFEPVSSQAGSVFKVHGKFSDIKRVTAPPRLVAVVHKKVEVPHFGLLANVGDVIERDAPAASIASLAEAA